MLSSPPGTALPAASMAFPIGAEVVVAEGGSERPARVTKAHSGGTKYTVAFHTFNGGGKTAVHSAADLSPADTGSVMRACFYERHGNPRATARVGWIARPPPPGAGQLLVRVHAAALNPADWKSAGGEQALLISFAWPRVYGMDFSGEIVACGADAGGPAGGDGGPWRAGDAVFGMIRGLPQLNKGTVAEYVLVDADVCARCPAGIPHRACAGVPLVAITAVRGLRACGLRDAPQNGGGGGAAGPRVFITGGAGGMGCAAIQLAKALFGASYVATTASPGAKTALCARLGADRVVNYRTERFEDALRGGGDGADAELFDAILDCTGEAARCVPLLRKGGGLVSILSGPTVSTLRRWLTEVRLDPASVTCGVRPFLFSRPGGAAFELATGAWWLKRKCAARGATFDSVIGAGDGAIVARCAALMAQGRLEGVIDRVFPLAQAVDAIEHQKAGRAAGKVVVEVVQRAGDSWDGTFERSPQASARA